MPKMAYFRTPHIVGKALRRPSAPAMRGSLRRNGPDNIIPSPYFSGLPAGGGTVIVQSKYSPSTPPAIATVSVPASPAGNVVMDAVLTAFNAALTSVKVVAFDDGGCIGLMSSSSYPMDAWFKVTGGTAAAPLGFDVTLQPFFTSSGDLKSAPEARIGNPFGAALPTPGENFDSDSVTRAFGRIAANMDVIYSEIAREEVIVSKIGTITGPNEFINLNSIAPGQRIFTAGTPNSEKVLTPDSSREELARFFYLMDPETGQIAQSAVDAVTDSSDADLLGIEKLVITASISDIPSGDIVRISNSTSNVTAGDYVKITGATNGDWRNNGYRWVVEEVPAPGSLRLRPMSMVELEQVGETIDDSQPIVELSAKKAPGETYGSVSVYRSPFTTGVLLHVYPSVPMGATYDVYAPIPVSQRWKYPSTSVDSHKPLFADLVRTAKVVPDAILTAPPLTPVAGQMKVAVGEFYARRNGRAFRIPASQVAVANPSDGALYFDPNTCLVDGSGTAPAGAWLIAITFLDGAALAVAPATKLDALPAVVSVGSTGCAFIDLASAARYAVTTEKHVHAILMEDQVLTELCYLPSNLLVRGATPSVIISQSFDGAFFEVLAHSTDADTQPVLENLVIEATDPTTLCGGGDKITLRNVRWMLADGSDLLTYIENRRVQVKDTIAQSGTDFNSSVEVTLKNLNGIGDRRSLALDLNSITTTGSLTVTGQVISSSLYVFNGVEIVGSLESGALTVHGDVHGNELHGTGLTIGVTSLSETKLRNLVDTLTGGASIYADTLHRHAELPSGFKIAGVPTDALVTASNLNALVTGGQTTLHSHAGQAHGDLGGGSLHAAVNVNTNTNGFMTATAQAKLDALTAGPTSEGSGYHRHSDASDTSFGFVSIYAQTLSGYKTFKDGLLAKGVSSAPAVKAWGTGVSFDSFSHIGEAIYAQADTGPGGHFVTASGVAGLLAYGPTGVLGTGNTLTPSSNATQTFGVRGLAGTHDGGVGVSGVATGGATAVLGEAEVGFGVYGTTDSGVGVVGSSTATGAGLKGYSVGSGNGIEGSSTSGYGAVLSGNATRAALRIVPRSGMPTSGQEGDITYNSDDGNFYGRTPAGWVVLNYTPAPPIADGGG